jgi:hypothetical protein
VYSQPRIPARGTCRNEWRQGLMKAISNRVQRLETRFAPRFVRDSSRTRQTAFDWLSQLHAPPVGPGDIDGGTTTATRWLRNSPSLGRVTR